MLLRYEPSGSKLDFACGNFELLNSNLSSIGWDQLQELEFFSSYAVAMQSSSKIMDALGKPFHFPCHFPVIRRTIPIYADIEALQL